MKRILFFVLLAVLACSCAAGRYGRGPESRDIEARTGHEGMLRAVEYPSGERQLSDRRMVVYLPKDYDRDTLRRYPVLYLLHGARGNEVTWIDSADVLHRLDSLRQGGLAQDFILVMPNMNRYFSDREYNNGHNVRAMRAFWLLDGEAERHFMQDVVAFTDRHFRTVPGKEARALAGMSSGALQALYLSASHPDAFGYVGLFSPYAHPTFAAKYHRDVYGGLSWKLAEQFADPPAVYDIYIGRTDFFYPHMVLFDRRLTRKGYPHRFIVAEGGHEWYNWIDFYTAFCEKLFQQAQ